MLSLYPITKDNLDFAVKLQNELFPMPNCSARINYIDAINHNNYANYFLVYDNELCIGITGIYYESVDLESAWLGWFGVKEEFRRQHYGTKIIQLFEMMAINRGFTYARLYTDAIDNDAAISFYKANGYTCEEYNCPNDPACVSNKILIFSKSLTDAKVPLWNNKNIHLTSQMEKQFTEAIL